jgi:hypothetical protein
VKLAIGILITALFAQPAIAQQQRPRQRAAAPAERRPQTLTERTGQPDVVLDVPDLSVDNIALDVERLKVHLALDARVANLVRLTAGADAGIDKVKLEIVGVEAEAYLVVRLDRVADIVERALDTIDENPEIITRLLESVDSTVATVGRVGETALQPGGVVSQAVGTVGRTLENVTAPGGLLTQTVNTLGQTVQRTVETTGNIVERTLDTTGKVVRDETVGKVLDLPVLRQTTNAAGQIVKQVTDTTGAVIEVTTDRAGRIIGTKVVSQATAQPR